MKRGMWWGGGVVGWWGGMGCGHEYGGGDSA